MTLFRAVACSTCSRPLFRDEPRLCRVCWLAGETRWLRLMQREAGIDLLLSYLRWRTSLVSRTVS